MASSSLIYIICALCIPTKAFGNVNVLTTAEKQQILDLHNGWRRFVAKGLSMDNSGSFHPIAINMNELLWDPGLENIAKDYSSNCDYNTTTEIAMHMSHSDKLLATFAFTSRYVGKNVGVSMQRQRVFTSIVDIINSWFEESSNWLYGDRYNLNHNCITNEECTHFTQAVWAKTRYIGCGYYNHCPSVSSDVSLFYTNLICTYYPAGNIIGETAWISGDDTDIANGWCSHCDYDRVCDGNGLCSGGINREYFVNGDSTINQCDNGLGKNICIESFNSPSTIVKEQVSNYTLEATHDPKICRNQCDAYSISIQNTQKSDSNICLTYNIIKLFDTGICRKEIKSFELNLCQGDKFKINTKSNIITNVTSSNYKNIKAVPVTFNQMLTGIKIKMKFELQNDEQTFTLCLRNIFDDNAYSSLVSFHQKNHFYQCNKQHIVGLPCLIAKNINYQETTATITNDLFLTESVSYNNTSHNNTRNLANIQETLQTLHSHWIVLGILALICILLICGLIIISKQKNNIDEIGGSSLTSSSSVIIHQYDDYQDIVSGSEGQSGQVILHDNYKNCGNDIKHENDDSDHSLNTSEDDEESYL